MDNIEHWDAQARRDRASEREKEGDEQILTSGTHGDKRDGVTSDWDSLMSVADDMWQPT